MAADPNRIAEDLRGLISGDVLSDELTRRLYASDGSLYEILPAVVVRPRFTEDVAATVRYAADQGTPVHARGGGSGLAGGCVGPGIVIDFSRYMRRVLAEDETTVRVQPGVVHADLNRRLASRGREFGPDPASTEVTTMGGVAAVDASGSRRLVYGSARDHVLGLTAILGDGSIVRSDPSDAENHKRLREALFSTIRSAVPSIRENTPRGCVNVSGYALEAALTDQNVDLAHLLVGSEGTLGLITELHLRTVAKPSVSGSVLLSFPSFEQAAEAAQQLVPLGVAACDLIDRRRIMLVREADPRYELLLSGATEAMLHVEVFAESEQELGAKVDQVVRAVRYDALASDAIVAETKEDRQLFAQLARQMVSAVHSMKGNRRAVTGVEDFALPPAALPQFFGRLQEILKRREVTAAVYGHIGHGQLHLRPLLDLTQPGDLRRLETLAGDLYDTVWLLGGTISGEHGDGLARTPFTSRQHGPLVNVFRSVKALCDPQGVLNPGKVVPLPGSRMTHDVRRLRAGTQAAVPASPTPRPPEVVELQLDWSLEQAAEIARTCNGCGGCRTHESPVRMCPIFRYTPREEASPRSKANLFRGVVTGDLPPQTLLRDEAKQVADLCVNCHQCRIDCPAKADIPKMMLEAKASYVATNGLRREAWLSAHIDSAAHLAARWPTLSNALMRSRWTRWILERTIGLAAGRRLPPFAARSYLQQAASRKLHQPAQTPEKVLYFVDTYANYFDTQLATALERVLQRHEVGVYVPTEQLHSGMAMISQGAFDLARRVAAENVARLAEAVRDGYAIVATEPSAVLALTHEYLNLLPDDEDVRLVAANTFEACHYLWRRHIEARLRLDLAPLPYHVAHHAPCHLQALEIGAPSTNLLRLIPELRLVRLEKGCSGMSGTFGLMRRNYRSSLRAGLPLLSELRSGRHQVGSTECGACRTQMEQNSRVPTIHPIKLLAASYGELPDLIKQLQSLTDNQNECRGD